MLSSPFCTHSFLFFLCLLIIYRNMGSTGRCISFRLSQVFLLCVQGKFTLHFLFLSLPHLFCSSSLLFSLSTPSLPLLPFLPSLAPSLSPPPFLTSLTHSLYPAPCPYPFLTTLSLSLFRPRGLITSLCLPSLSMPSFWL